MLWKEKVLGVVFKDKPSPFSLCLFPKYKALGGGSLRGPRPQLTHNKQTIMEEMFRDVTFLWQQRAPSHDPSLMEVRYVTNERYLGDVNEPRHSARISTSPAPPQRGLWHRKNLEECVHPAKRAPINSEKTPAFNQRHTPDTQASWSQDDSQNRKRKVDLMRQLTRSSYNKLYWKSTKRLWQIYIYITTSSCYHGSISIFCGTFEYTEQDFCKSYNMDSLGIAWFVSD